MELAGALKQIADNIFALRELSSKFSDKQNIE